MLRRSRSLTQVSGHRVLALASASAVMISLAGLAPASAADGGYGQTAVTAQESIDAALAATGATSITAGLTDTAALLWEGTTGVVDSGGARPGPTTRYGIGSTSKMLATAAVMQLVDAGRVGLDEPVVRYLPQFTMASPEYRQVTVRMLLDHSAGFPGTAYGNAFTTVPFDGYADEVLANLATSRLKTTPGAMSVYCNDCFTVAGQVAAHVSGMPFTDYVDRRLLSPLGMSHSEYVTGDLPAAGTVARVVAGGRTQPLEVTNVYASGGLMSTPEDMLSFARMLLTQGTSNGTTILTAGSIAQMGQPQLRTTLEPITRSVWNYGLGWDSVKNLSLDAVGVRAWVKGGDTSDYHSGLVVAPEAGLAAFVAGAGTFSSSSAEALAVKILLKALADRGDIASMPVRVGLEQPAVATPSEDDINAMLGTFLGAPGLAYRIASGPGSSLVVENVVDGAWVARPVAMTFRVDGAWWPDTPASQYLRSVTGWGRTYLAIGLPDGYGNVYGEQVIGQRVRPSGSIAKAWRGRLGEWLAVGDLPTSTLWLGSPKMILSQVPGLAGYLDASGLSPIDASRPDVGSMFLQVPLMFGRDLDDLVPVGKGLMRMGTAAMVARSGVPTLPAGSSHVRIGSQGFAEWRAVGHAGRLTLTGAQAWYLYDKDVMVLKHGRSDAKALPAPSGSLLVVFGDPGDDVTVAMSSAR